MIQDILNGLLKIVLIGFVVMFVAGLGFGAILLEVLQ